MTAASFKRVSFKPRVGLIVCAALLALAGCAQKQEAGRYRAQSTLTDAQAQAQGRTASRPPGQIQLGFGEDAPKRGTQAPANEAEQADKAALAAQIRPLREAKTFLGTLPCLLGGSCEASRVTMT